LITGVLSRNLILLTRNCRQLILLHSNLSCPSAVGTRHHVFPDLPRALYAHSLFSGQAHVAMGPPRSVYSPNIPCLHTMS